MKGWYSAELRRLPTMLERVAQISQEMTAPNFRQQIMKAMMLRAYFLGQEYKPPVYRKWGIPNG